MLSKKRIFKLIILFCLIVNISALIAAGRSKGSGRNIGDFALDLFSPVEEFFSDSVKNLSNIWEGYFDLISVSKENRKLKNEIYGFHSKETLYQEALLENQRLRELLNFSKKIENRFIAAEVIGRDSSRWFNTIIVNRGKSSGVDLNYPVIVPQGIVGQIIDVSKEYSKVLLITDRTSGVDSLVQKTRRRGVVSGTGGNICELKYLLRKFGVENGDHIITSGMDGVFPKGLRVGSIIGIERKSSGIFQNVKVQPFVDFEKLEEVIIIFKPRNRIEK